MLRTSLVVVAVAACALARPQQLPQIPALPVIPGFPRPVPNASGQSQAGINSGLTQTPFGNTNIDQLSGATGGLSNNGGVNTGTASASKNSFAGPFGSGQNQQTSATSNQFTNPIQIPNFGQSQGQAQGQVTTGTTTDIFGGKTQVTSVSSAAGGSVVGPGASINTANAGTNTSSGPFGEQSASNVDLSSTQTTGR